MKTEKVVQILNEILQAQTYSNLKDRNLAEFRWEEIKKEVYEKIKKSL